MIPQVIGISGNMGAGKTTLAKTLSELWNATRLMWDDFDDISQAPPDYVEWYHRGENYNEWDYPALENSLRLLKSNQSVKHPALDTILNPTQYIIFDAPLGRLHKQTGQHIDIHIHIEVPLDVSLCRHIIRDFKDNDKTKAELLYELEYYLSHSRPLFFDDNLKTRADLVIDGMTTIQQQVQKIEEYVRRNKL